MPCSYNLRERCLPSLVQPAVLNRACTPLPNAIVYQVLLAEHAPIANGVWQDLIKHTSIISNPGHTTKFQKTDSDRCCDNWVIHP